MTDLAFRPAGELAAQLRARTIGAEELLRHLLDRIDRLNPSLNAVILRDDARALAQARAADAAIGRGEVGGPLHGLPMTVKEAFDVAGLPTTWGVEAWRDNVPTRDSAVVRRLRAAGAIIFGKTNVPSMLADWQTFNPIHGTTNNPWSLARTPGGSSGGAAAALAAGFTPLEIGSDIGGSIRGPAHYCGVFGHKPTFGIVDLDGQAPPGFSADAAMSVAGPMARCAADLALALDILAGPPDQDAAAWRLCLPQPKPAEACRVAVIVSHSTAEVDRTVQTAILALADALARMGVQVDFAARPAFDFDAAHELFILLLRAATSAGLPDEALEAAAQVARDRPRDHGYVALQARGNSLRHRDWLQLDRQRRRFSAAWRAFFDEYDLLLCPAAATPAFPHNQTGSRWERMLAVNGHAQPSTTQMFWAGLAGMAYLPATVAPIALSPEGLPIGVQIVGPRFDDLTCIGFAAFLERRYHAFTAPLLPTPA